MYEISDKIISRVAGAETRRGGLLCWRLKEHKTASKTGRPRVVWMTATTARICKRLAKRWKEGNVFRYRTGRTVDKDLLAREMRTVRHKAGIVEPVTCYTIRHTFATRAIIAGKVDLVTLSELMGHTSVKMLSTIYQHVAEDADHMRQAAAEASRSRPQKGQRGATQSKPQRRRA